MDDKKGMLNSSPWKRYRPEVLVLGPWLKIPKGITGSNFDDYVETNMDLDIETKRLVLKLSPSVVSIGSYRGREPLIFASGTIIDCQEVDGIFRHTILTSASVLGASEPVNDIKIDIYLWNEKTVEGQDIGHDFHFNIAMIEFVSDKKFPVASLKCLDLGQISHNFNMEQGLQSFQFHPHSDLFGICPGDMVIAMGRDFNVPNPIMAAPGMFSLDSCRFDCKELLVANCLITGCGIGGPLINCNGDVIGVNFYDETSTPFLPINIALKCLGHFRKYRRFYRPSLGIEGTNLYAARIGILERILNKFPTIFGGALIEKVKTGSCADKAGILPGDVIIQCGDTVVRSYLEFLEQVWDRAGVSVDVSLIRAANGLCLNLTLAVDEITSPDLFNHWPVPEMPLGTSKLRADSWYFNGDSDPE